MALARAQMVSNFTFFNLQLNIDNLGNTKRTAGTFMDVFNLHDHIDPVTGKERIVDRKLLGRWFITSVRHRFFKDSYQTVLQCIKPYVGPGSVDKKITAPLHPDLSEIQSLIPKLEAAGERNAKIQQQNRDDRRASPSHGWGKRFSFDDLSD